MATSISPLIWWRRTTRTKRTITLTPDKLYVHAAQQGQPAVSKKAKLAVRAKSILTGQERRSTIAIKAQVDGETRRRGSGHFHPAASYSTSRFPHAGHCPRVACDGRSDLARWQARPCV